MKKHKFQPVSPHINFPELEERVIKYWKENKIFEKSITSRPKEKQWTFLDGPPFITGLPHYGSLLSSIPKDVFPRFWTMKGYRVRRVWGWDCHGLPAENKVEEKLGLRRKKDIEEIVGVKKFIEECKLYVNNISHEWEWYVDHVGRWVDFKNAYRTMDLTYMESVMWVFKQMYEKGFIYKGLRVSLYCPHCATPISNFEVAMDADNYKEITESGTTYKYQLVDEPDTYVLAWSTTPWNKLVTPALAVNPKLTYVKIKQGQEYYILAQATRTQTLSAEPYQIIGKMKGKALLGKKFVSHYAFYKITPGKKAFIIVGGDFVTSEEGTGVVTIAAYGEEDLMVMQRDNIHFEMHLDEEGRLKSYVPKWAGLNYLKVNPLVNEDLASRGLIYADKPFTHTVPTCWRCHTRLYYSPQDAWYVDVAKLKPKMKQTNEAVNWFPPHFKYGRFLKSMEAAPDWCISRNRYWGSPVPVWECDCGERFIPGSIAELEKRGNQKVRDLHKPEIDEVVIICQKCSKKVRRVPEVLDSWIEAGSAAFAERHFPINKDAKLEDFFPPDFIVEYTGQIRAWFYVLHVISTALFNSHAFKNVVVTGVILGTDGRKMSKNYGNYPDPKELLAKYGGDALRLYLMGSPVMHGEDILISEAQYINQVRGFLLLLWNVFNFFLTCAHIDNWKPINEVVMRPRHVLDKWILSILSHLIQGVTNDLEHFDTVAAVTRLHKFLDLLSRWYVRRTRDRVRPGNLSEDKREANETLWIVLFEYAKVLAPFVPFVSEEIYKTLTNEESVHLVEWPKVYSNYLDSELEKQMDIGITLASQIHALRKTAAVKVRIPLRLLKYSGPQELKFEVLQVVKDEANVYELQYAGNRDSYSVSGQTNLANQDLEAGESRELIRQIQLLRKKKGYQRNQQIQLTLPDRYQTLPVALLDDIKRKTLVESVIWGDKLSILTG